jgi:hypothetical protein
LELGGDRTSLNGVAIHWVADVEAGTFAARLVDAVGRVREWRADGLRELDAYRPFVSVPRDIGVTIL